MKLTPRQTRFLKEASLPNADVRKVITFYGANYWIANNYELREKWGDMLRSANLIESMVETGQSGRSKPYRITDLGRSIVSVLG